MTDKWCHVWVVCSNLFSGQPLQLIGQYKPILRRMEVIIGRPAAKILARFEVRYRHTDFFGHVAFALS